jgi:hypothetical protein
MSEDGSGSGYYYYCDNDEFCPFSFYDVAFKDGSSTAGTTCCSKQIIMTYYLLWYMCFIIIQAVRSSTTKCRNGRL